MTTTMPEIPAATNGRMAEHKPVLSDFEQLLEKPLRITPMERFMSKKQDMWDIATAMFLSGLASHLKSKEAIFAVMLYGWRFGWDVWTSVQNCHVINGRVSQSAASMLAIAIENGATFTIKESGRKGNDDPVGEWCDFTLTRPGFEPVTKTWTQEDAARAGLAKDGGNHQKYPAAMLQWRAVADACRVLYSDKLAGIRASEEMGEQILGANGADPDWAAKQTRGKKKGEEKQLKADQLPPVPGDDAPPVSPADPVDPALAAPAPTATTKAGRPKAEKKPTDDGPTEPNDIADVFLATKSMKEKRQYIDSVIAVNPALVKAEMKTAGVLNLDHADENEIHNVAWNVRFAMEGGRGAGVHSGV